jgi:hypothetical protein
MNLAVDDQRIDQFSAILGDGEMIDADFVGFRIDLDRRNMSGRGRGAEYRIVGHGGGKLVAGVRRQGAGLRMDGARHLPEGDDAIGAGNGDKTCFGDEVGGGGFKQMRGGIEDFVTHRLCGKRCRAAGEHHAAAGIGPGAAVGGGGTVALNDAHVLDPHAEMFGDDLRQRRLQALAVRGDAERRGHGAAWLDADGSGFRAGIDRHARRHRDT